MRRGIAGVFVLVLVGVAGAQEPAKPSAPAAPSTAERKVADGAAVIEQLKTEATALRPLLATELARSFLDMVGALPEPTSHVVLRDKARTHAYTTEEAAKLPEDERGALTPRTFDPAFFYYTGYGSPLVYARALDVLGAGAPASLAGKKVMDFGCGTIAHLRMMAAMGADVHGVEVEPVFRVLYGQTGDQGEVAGIDSAPPGRVAMHIGRWPAEREIVREVGGGYDLITSKNTLKRGYIHPARKTDPRFLVHLGVDDATFLRHVHDALKPGGLFLIYNLSPAQNTVESGKPYLPHADGECPFEPEQFAAARLEILELDHNDRDKAVEVWMALGIGGEKSAEETRKDLFAWYTLCRRSLADSEPTSRVEISAESAIDSVKTFVWGKDAAPKNGHEEGWTVERLAQKDVSGEVPLLPPGEAVFHVVGKSQSLKLGTTRTVDELTRSINAYVDTASGVVYKLLLLDDARNPNDPALLEPLADSLMEELGWSVERWTRVVRPEKTCLVQALSAVAEGRVQMAVPSGSRRIVVQTVHREYGIGKLQQSGDVWSIDFRDGCHGPKEPPAGIPCIANLRFIVELDSLRPLSANNKPTVRGAMELDKKRSAEREKRLRESHR